MDYMQPIITRNHTHKPAMEKARGYTLRKKRMLSYRKELIETFDTDPLLCECGHYILDTTQ